MRITAAANLPSLVRAAFSRAAAAGALTYYQTKVALLFLAPPSPLGGSGSSVPFQLRFSPALASKPKPVKIASACTTGQSPPLPRFNPFADPDPALLVGARLSGPAAHHTLVLNKFAVVPGHFLLITDDFRPQTHLLEAADLEAAYACVRAYRQDDDAGGGPDGDKSSSSELFVFFNSGPHSGASQPHRHLQLLPVESMKAGLGDAETIGLAIRKPGHGDETQQKTKELEEEEEWTPLINTLHHQHHHHQAPTVAPSEQGASTRSTGPPFEVFSTPIGPETSPAQRHAAYLDLYHRACAAVDEYISGEMSGEEDGRQQRKLEEAAVQETGEARISYNLAMTGTVMALCPRLAEGSDIYSDVGSGDADEAGSVVGKVELNGTVLAGTALVKSEAEWNALRRDPGQLLHVLSKIGIPTRGPNASRAPGTNREASL